MSETEASEETKQEITVGDRVNVRADRPAHGGESIGTVDERVVFLEGALPGDTVVATVTQKKKRFLRAAVDSVAEGGPYRGPSRCDAAAAGAGCCDFHEVIPEKEAELKRVILEDQLHRIGHFDGELPSIEIVPIDDAPGYRTRARFGVNTSGHAGVRKRHSNEVLTTRCSAIDPRIYNVVEQHTFTPGAEVVCAMDANGEVHVKETVRAPRGKRVSNRGHQVSGDKLVQEMVGTTPFEFPVTGFWQAHKDIPELFSSLIRTATESDDFSAATPTEESLVGWDLYGGVGALAPAVVDALGSPEAEVISVDTTNVKDWQGSDQVAFARGDVAATIATLPNPALVILDPPRTGASDKTIADIAMRRPQRVIHFGCDPATCARDLRTWVDNGYQVDRIFLVNAFPGSYHFETVVSLSATN
ncbi:MAG: TRAM domain-containing protein [Corynebacterium glucuronolyticum]|nr:TRAM domain-containing protein [Mycobacteriaceae bacterium]MDY5835010.1 TRAM domain-containing protein [Corynebacterium glucuronolyticum]